MKRTLLAILLLAFTSALSSSTAEPTVFQRACAASESVCDFRPPLIVYTQMVDGLPCFGCTFRGVTYTGEPYVFVNRLMPEAEQEQTAFHEALHYLLHAEGREFDTMCAEEEYVRKLTALEFNLPYDDEWQKFYPDCPVNQNKVQPTEAVQEALEIFKVILEGIE